MSTTAPLNVSQVGSSIFGMLSGMFAALSTSVITTLVKTTVLIDKSLNVAINGVSAAENISEAVEKRSKIYGEGIVANGELAERETRLKYILRLNNLEKQEGSATAPFVPVKDTINYGDDNSQPKVVIESAVPKAEPA